MKRRKESESAVRPRIDWTADSPVSDQPASTMAAIDIGSDYSSVWNPSNGSVSHPSIIAVDTHKAVHAAGLEAILAGARRDNRLVTEKPFAADLTPDPNTAEIYLRWLFQEAGFHDLTSVPVFLAMHAESPPDPPLALLLADLGADPMVIHRPVAAAIGLDVAAGTASNHLMVELWEDGAEIAFIKGGMVARAETVYGCGRDLVESAIVRLLFETDPIAELEIRDSGIHVYGWAAQQKALSLTSAIGLPLASPVGSGTTIIEGARLLAESVLPWLAGTSDV